MISRRRGSRREPLAPALGLGDAFHVSGLCGGDRAHGKERTGGAAATPPPVLRGSY